MSIRVMLCCNDYRNGNDLGYAESIKIEDVTLVGGRVTSNYYGRKLKSAKPYEGENALRIGRLLVPALSYQTWVGNWCWDCAAVRSVHALRILNFLAAKPDWHCEDAETSIFQAFNDRRKVKAEEWKAFRAAGVAA